MAPKSMSSEVENIEIKAKKKQHGQIVRELISC